MAKQEWKNLPKNGTLMTMKDWIEAVEDGWFIDYDGYGQYATEEKLLDGGYVDPSDLKKGNVDKTHTHILWFNR